MLRVSPLLHILQLSTNTFTYQEYNGKLSFTTDSWTSPNHKALVAFSVHFADEGKAHSITLDVVEVAEVSTM